MSQEKPANHESENPADDALKQAEPTPQSAQEVPVEEASQVDAVDNEFDWQQYANELETKLSAAEAKVNEQKDSVLRAKAEGENARRRAEQEVDKARKFALEKFAGELLNVADNLERAIQAADANNEALKALVEGVELTQKSLLSVFEKFQVQVVDPQGETFNPEHHQAMSMQESDEVAPNTVIAVMQKGYLLNGRLLRPAMVMVSRASSGSVDTQA